MYVHHKFMQIQLTVSSELKSYTPKKISSGVMLFFLWLGCIQSNATLLIHFNDIILKTRIWYISSIVRKDKLLPFANLVIIFFPIIFHRKDLKTNFSWAISVISNWVLLRNEQHSVNFTQLSLAVVKFTMPPICYLALTAKYMKIIFF